MDASRKGAAAGGLKAESVSGHGGAPPRHPEQITAHGQKHPPASRQHAFGRRAAVDHPAATHNPDHTAYHVARAATLGTMQVAVAHEQQPSATNPVNTVNHIAQAWHTGEHNVAHGRATGTLQHHTVAPTGNKRKHAVALGTQRDTLAGSQQRRHLAEKLVVVEHQAAATGSVATGRKTLIHIIHTYIQVKPAVAFHGHMPVLSSCSKLTDAIGLAGGIYISLPTSCALFRGSMQTQSDGN